MARPLRIEYQGAWYHVMNRGGAHRDIFLRDEHRELFLTHLHEIWEQYKVEVHAYCLMGNHYHLLLRTRNANLGKAMRHLNGLYTQRFNRMEKSDGPLFRGRYKAILVQQDPYLLQVSRYIHRNPVDAALVKNSVEYSWSSYRFFVTPEPVPPFLTTEFTLNCVGKRNQRKAYSSFVERVNEEEIYQFYQKKKQLPILGTQSFRDRFKDHERWKNKEISERAILKKQTPIKVIVKEVAKAFERSSESLLKSQRGVANEPRSVAIYLSRQLEDFPLQIVADYFGISHYSRISKVHSSIKQKIKKNPELKRKIEQIILTITT
jgi:putative transposase